MLRAMIYRSEESERFSSEGDMLGGMKIEPGKASEFSLFHDYLGLINLVLPQSVSSPIDSPTDSPTFEYPNMRHRMDSYDSDSISDSSSNGSRSDVDVFYDNLPSDVSKSNDVPFMQESQIIPFVPGLESLLARQTAINHLHSVISANKSNQKSSNKAAVCVFCRNNGESKEFYSSHTLKDSEGNTTCPILRAYTCPLCKASGDQSHTIKYCPNYTPKMRENKLLGIPI